MSLVRSLSVPTVAMVGGRRRLTLALMAVTILASGLLAGLDQATDAAAQGGPVRAQYGVRIYESNYDVFTGIPVYYGERVVISCWDTIWAGVWFTGRNGPDGWVGYNAGWDYPLPNAWSFSVLGKLNNSYFFVGSGHQRYHYAAASWLYLRINDNVPGNGNGFFTCNVEVYNY